MAISPPSDLILDVVKAADPLARQEATNRLSRLAESTETGSVPFSDFFGSTRVATQPSTAVSAGNTGDKQSPAQQFEAVILHQFVESMLPMEATAVFGEGSTGEIWKSMMAEQVANQIAASGGIGIAGLLSDQLNSGAGV